MGLGLAPGLDKDTSVRADELRVAGNRGLLHPPRELVGAKGSNRPFELLGNVQTHDKYTRPRLRRGSAPIIRDHLLSVNTACRC